MLRAKPLLCLLLFAASACAAASAQQPSYHYWVQFADKADSPYSLSQPEEFLSPRALERRHRQGIALDSLDLPVNPQYVQALRDAGFRIAHTSRWMNGAVAVADQPNRAAAAEALPCVASAILCEERFSTDTSAWDTPQPMISAEGFDSLYGKQYYGDAFEQIALMNGQALHRAGYCGQGLLIGVCDGGFPCVDRMQAFATLRAEGRLVASRDFVTPGTSVFNGHQHGTMVLGCMAAEVPGAYVGTAPKASYVLCRTENVDNETPTECYNWIAAMEYLDSMGADIVNTSLGYPGFDDCAFDFSQSQLDGRTAPMSRAADIAASRGMLAVIAAGNDGRNGSPSLSTPGDAERALTVGAVTLDGEVADFSSRGPTADGRIKPDITAVGEAASVVSAFGYLDHNNGTSFASPIAAGMMACLWQRMPEATPAQLCDSVRRWGSRSLSPDSDYGYGTPDFSRALAGAASGTGSIPQAFKASLSPNPASGSTLLSLPPTALPAHAELMDANGRRIATFSISQPRQRIPLPSRNGLHFLRITSGTATGITRLIIL